MSEPDVSEHFYSQEARETAVFAGRKLLTELDYSYLNENDLRQYKILPSDQSFADFMAEGLALHDSIQKTAFNKRVGEIPPPQDTSEYYDILNTNFFTPEEELALRQHALGQKNDLLNQIGMESGHTDFAAEIIKAADIFNNGNEHSYDPEMLRQSLSQYEMSLHESIGLFKINGKWCFALKVAKNDLGPQLAAMTSSLSESTISNYVVVTDEEKNSALSTYLYSHPALFRHFLAHTIVNSQRIIYEQQKELFRSIATKKYEQLKKDFDAVNWPLVEHAFNLLASDAGIVGSIYLTSIFRDRHDVNSLKGEAPPKFDRLGSESSATDYQVQIVDDNKLQFSWVGNGWVTETSYEDDKPKSRQVLRSFQYSVKVKLNRDKNILEYAIENDDYKSGNEVMWPAINVKYMFDSVEATSFENLLKTGQPVIDEAQGTIKELLQTRSSVDFFSKLRQLCIGGYPNREVMVSTTPDFIYQVGVFAPPNHVAPQNN